MRLFSCDLRSLAVLRIFLGSWIVLEVLSRSQNFVKHYTDLGYLPTDVAAHLLSIKGWWSLNVLSGSMAFQVLMFFLTFLAGVAVLFGYKTKWASLASYVLLTSLQNRFPLALFPGDYISRTLLLFGFFAPLGEIWSIDSRRRKTPLPSINWFNPGTFSIALYIIVFIIYTGFSKTGQSWKDGTAVYWVLNTINDTSHNFDFIADKMWLLTGLTWGTQVVEIFAGLLLLFPFYFGPVRTLSVLAISAFLFGFGTGLLVWVLPFLQIGGMLALLPSWFWDVLIRRPKELLKGRWSSGHSPKAYVEPFVRGHRWKWIVCGTLSFLITVDFVRKVGEAGHFNSEFLNFPAPILAAYEGLGLKFPFAMYRAPEKNFNGWFTLIGSRDDGSQIDLVSQQPVSWDIPKNANSTVGGFRDKRFHRFLLLEITGVQLIWRDLAEKIYPLVAKYFCTKENGPSGLGSMKTFEVWIAKYDLKLPPVFRDNFTKDKKFAMSCETAMVYHFDLKD